MLYTQKLADELKANLSDVILKVDEDKSRTFDVIATTQDTDRDNEVIKINWRDTKNWEKNPVVLANHSYTIENIIWKGIKFYTSNWVKRLQWIFSKSNPMGILARELYNEWMLKSVSVWFIPTKRNEVDYKIIEKAELLEVSFVAVPCNPNAISLDKKIFDEWIEKWLIKEIQEDDKEVTEDPEIKYIKEELNEIKTLLKILTDDKVAEKEIDAEIAKAKEQKEFLQNINKGTALALENIKKLF